MNWDIENTYFSETVNIVCGCDEAGRGPLAGPVYAAAVILPRGLEIAGVNDSKKISPAKRDLLFDEICEKAVSFCIARSEVSEIESMNILNASLLAMRRAIAGLSVKPDVALIDGCINRDFPLPAYAIVKGDSLCPSIAAASILAKVSRDRFCAEMDRMYPEYGFLKHKGYGTKAHYEALDKYGPCPEHRMSFLRSFFEKK